MCMLMGIHIHGHNFYTLLVNNICIFCHVQDFIFVAILIYLLTDYLYPIIDISDHHRMQALIEESNNPSDCVAYDIVILRVQIL